MLRESQSQFQKSVKRISVSISKKCEDNLSLNFKKMLRESQSQFQKNVNRVSQSQFREKLRHIINFNVMSSFCNNVFIMPFLASKLRQNRIARLFFGREAKFLLRKGQACYYEAKYAEY